MPTPANAPTRADAPARDNAGTAAPDDLAGQDGQSAAADVVDAASVSPFTALTPLSPDGATCDIDGVCQ